LRLISPGGSVAVPLARASSTLRMMRLAPICRGAAVAKIVEFGEVVPGVDVEQRHRQLRGTERFFREAQEADRILAAGEQNRRTVEFARDLAHDVDRFRLEPVEVIEVVGTHFRRLLLGVGAQTCCALFAATEPRAQQDCAPTWQAGCGTATRTGATVE